MVGMVESLNTCFAALSMYELTKNSQKLLGDEKYQLSPERREEILSNWVCRRSRNYELELERLREQKTKPLLLEEALVYIQKNTGISSSPDKIAKKINL